MTQQMPRPTKEKEKTLPPKKNKTKATKNNKKIVVKKGAIFMGNGDYFTPFKFFTSVLTDIFSLESE